VEAAAGLLEVGPSQVALEVLREGAGALAADQFFLSYLTGETLIRAARLLVGTGLPGTKDEALELARAAPVRDGEHLGVRKDALAAVAWALMEQGRADEAVAVAAEALRVTWEYVSIVPERAIYREAAEALTAIGDVPEMARSMARRALAAPSEEQDCWLELLEEATLHQLSGDRSEAATLVDRLLTAVDSARENDPAWKHMAGRVAGLCRPLRRLGRVEVAERLAWEALDMQNARVRAGGPGMHWSSLFDVFNIADDFLGQDAVLAAVQQATQGGLFDVWRERWELMVARLAETAARSRDEVGFERLRAWLGDLEERRYRLGDIAVTLARGLLALERHEEAVELLGRSLASLHPERQARYQDPVLLADALLKAGMITEILRLAEEPLHPSALSGVAVVLARAGRRHEAEKALRQAFIEAGCGALIFDVLGRSFQALAEWREPEIIVALVHVVATVARLRPEPARGTDLFPTPNKPAWESG